MVVKDTKMKELVEKLQNVMESEIKPIIADMPESVVKTYFERSLKSFDKKIEDALTIPVKLTVEAKKKLADFKRKLVEESSVSTNDAMPDDKKTRKHKN